MFYKAVKDGRVVDVLDRIDYVRYDKRHDAMYYCEPSNSNAFLSQDHHSFWRVRSMEPCDKEITTVVLTEIDESEYMQLRALSMKTPEEIIDAYTLALVTGGII